MKVKDLKLGDLFVLKAPKEGVEVKASQVFVCVYYDRTENKYCCGKWSDGSAFRFLKGDTEVYTDFIF